MLYKLLFCKYNRPNAGKVKMWFYLVGVGDESRFQRVTTDASIVRIDGHSREGGERHEKDQTWYVQQHHTATATRSY